jgi:hypothetical protein
MSAYSQGELLNCIFKPFCDVTPYAAGCVGAGCVADNLHIGSIIYTFQQICPWNIFLLEKQLISTKLHCLLQAQA